MGVCRCAWVCVGVRACMCARMWVSSSMTKYEHDWMGVRMRVSVSECVFLLIFPFFSFNYPLLRHIHIHHPNCDTNINTIIVYCNINSSECLSSSAMTLYLSIYISWEWYLSTGNIISLNNKDFMPSFQLIMHVLEEAECIHSIQLKSIIIKLPFNK